MPAVHWEGGTAMKDQIKGGEPPLTRIHTFGSLSVEGAGVELLRHPKSLALLIYLAVTSRGGFCRRDTLVATFWPESDQDRARASLRSSLHTLRRFLSDGSIETAGDEMVRVNPRRVFVDAVAFEQAIEEGREEDALGHYRGSFLTGVHVSGAAAFGEWRDGREREYLRSALAAALRLAELESGDGALDPLEHRWLERAIALAPFEDEPARRLIQEFVARGDGAGAVSVFQDHERRLASLGLSPAPATIQLVTAFLDRSASERPTGGPVDRLAGMPVQGALLGPLPAEGPADVGDNPVGESGAERQKSSEARRPRTTAALALIATLTGLLAWSTASHRAETEGLERMRGLVASLDYVEAHRTALRLERWLAGDEVFEALWDQATYRLSVTTNPEPARVAIRDYREVDAPWIELGTTPLEDVRIPSVYLRWRIERPGRPPEVRAAFDATARDHIHFEMSPSEPRPGMAYVSGDAPNPGAPVRLPLDPYWMDEREVTNGAYAAFVASEHYPDDPSFRDRSGAAGPATWVSGGFPPGQGAHPVAGISWYEADAFCRWVGKELPTLYHWLAAGGYNVYSDIIETSNFSGHGPVSTTSTKAIGPYGHGDLAGNVREWVANETGSRRYVVGGAWDTPPYLFYVPDAAKPSDRSSNNGFRCAVTGLPATHKTRAPVPPRAAPRPVVASDLDLEARLAYFAYDRAPLEATVDSTSNALTNWRREFVSFVGAYGAERLSATVFLPRQGRPPYPTVIYHPGAEANHLTDSKAVHTTWFDFLSSAGYAIIHPVYKGTFERRERISGPIGVRNQVVQRVKDVSRTIDYLEQRDDLATEAPVFYGFSEGGVLAPLVAAVESRIGAVVVLSGGLFGGTLDPVIDPGHYLPSAGVPLLMIGGEFDFVFPFERSQKPYFDAWGAPGDDKRLVALPTGHTPRDLRAIAGEVLTWLAPRRTGVLAYRVRTVN